MTEEEKLRRKREYDRQWKLANRDKVLAARRRYTKKYPDKIKAENKKFREKNPNYKKEYYQAHKEEAKKWYANRNEEQKAAKALYNKAWKSNRYKTNVAYKLRCIVFTAISRSLKTDKDKEITKLLGYTIKELKEHLEKQFEQWMTWDNLGTTSAKPKQTWQIDHIRPVNTFNITGTDCDDFKKCWALDNLRPLDSYINVSRPKDGSDVVQH